MSVYDELLDAVVAKIAGLSLALGDDAVTVQKRKLPGAQDVIDTLPLIAVVPSERLSRDVPFDSGGANGRKYREYIADVVIISAGNRDPVSNLPDYLDWRQKIARAFGQPASVEVPELIMTRVSPDVVVDRSIYNDNYDYSGLELTMCCVEDAN